VDPRAYESNQFQFKKDADIGCAPKLDTRRFGGIFVATAEGDLLTLDYLRSFLLADF
jgi:hypothetical protein